MKNLFKSSTAFAVVAILSLGFNTVTADEEDESASAVEEVVVTGSRIKRASNYDSTGPVEVFTAQQVLDAGKTSIGDFLIELPSANLASNQRSVNNGNSGTTELNLRGAGSNRLLTLINGRRVAPSGTGTGGAVDLQIFPLSLIDSVEVLKDGASAVYGSDAISGVLNIKLRQFEGFEAYISEGSSNKGDAKQDLISLSFGTAGERSSMVATLAQQTQDSLDMWDRDFSFCPRVEPDYMLYFQSFGIPGHGASGEKLQHEASCGASTFIPTGRFYTTAGSKTLYDGVGPTGDVSSFSFATYSGNRAGDPQNNRGMYNYSEWMQLLGERENRQAWAAGTFETDSGIVTRFSQLPFVNITELFGTPDVGFVSGETEAYKAVRLVDQKHTTRGTVLVNNDGTIHDIGRAKTRGIEHNSGSASGVFMSTESLSTNTYKHYLFDIVMFAHLNVRGPASGALTTGETLTGGTSGATGIVESLTSLGEATITGITQANPPVVTCSGGHNFKEGQTIKIASVSGMTEVNTTNDGFFTVKNPSATTFELFNEATAASAAPIAVDR